MNLSHYQTAVFDCDGVILQSNHLKTTAFRESLAGEPCELIDKFIAYHEQHGGVSRHQKFAHYYAVIKPQENVQDLIRAAEERFAAAVREQLLQAKLVPGVEKVLALLNSQQTNCYVISGGVEDEVQDVLQRRGLDKYFSDVFGSPKSKSTHLQKLQAENKLQRPGVFFGDAKTDFDAAAEFQLDFCFISGYTLWQEGLHFCKSKTDHIFKDFTDVDRYQ